MSELVRESSVVSHVVVHRRCLPDRAIAAETRGVFTRGETGFGAETTTVHTRMHEGEERHLRSLSSAMHGKPVVFDYF